MNIEKIKAAALAAHCLDHNESKEWYDIEYLTKCLYYPKNARFVEQANPSAVLELITRLEAAERDAAKWQEYQSKRARILDYGNPTNSGQLAKMKEKP